MLHDRYPLVVRLWRPVNKLYMCIRREWDIRGSLVQAFATFLVLSYVKILNVSFDLLTPQALFRKNGSKISYYLYYAGEVPYFQKEHLPFSALAVFMLITFNILPMVLLFLYPWSYFQKCLSMCSCRCLPLSILMDTFQGCYRHKPRDCRCFAALYFFMRCFQSKRHHVHPYFRIVSCTPGVTCYIDKTIQTGDAECARCSSMLWAF